MKLKLAIFAAALLSPIAAQAQTTVVMQPYFTFTDQISVDNVLREKRDGAKVTSAKIDICLSDYSAGKFDRVVIDLKPDGNLLSGSGFTQIQKTPVTFRYTYEHKGNDLNISGTLTVDGQKVSFEQERINEQTEQQYQETVYTVPAIVEAPADFSAVSPQWIGLKVKRGKLASVLDRLRKENVQIDSQFGLVEDCAVLRSETHIIQFSIAPERAKALIPELRKVDGVTSAGWSNFLSYIYGVRLPGNAWSAGGKPDRKKLQTELAKSVKSFTGGKVTSSFWDETTGDLVVQISRDSVKYPRLGFTELVEVRILAEYEKLDSPEHLVVWVLTAGAKLADLGAGPRMKIQVVSEIGAEGIYLDPDAISKKIARDLKGITYNMETEKWNEQ